MIFTLENFATNQKLNKLVTVGNAARKAWFDLEKIFVEMDPAEVSKSKE